MISPSKWFRRTLERYQQRPRKKILALQLEKYFQMPVELKPAATKGGYDQIYLAWSQRKVLGVIRVNNPFKKSYDPIGPEDPSFPLKAQDRLDREWKAYQILSPYGLSPQPIWRCEDAIACQWLDWKRLSTQMLDHQFHPLTAAQLVFQATRQMHDLGVTHLDLNLGNFLIEPNDSKVVLIDFEFGPFPSITLGQQMAFDYLKITQDCLRPRRGGKRLMPHIDSWLEILATYAHPKAKQAALPFAPTVLPRIYQAPKFIEALRRIFCKLPKL